MSRVFVTSSHGVACVQGIALPSGTQYVPMIFSASQATPANIADAKLSGSDTLLGFNEPNEKAQAANTVQVSSLDLPNWPTLREQIANLTVITAASPIGAQHAKMAPVLNHPQTPYTRGRMRFTCTSATNGNVAGHRRLLTLDRTIVVQQAIAAWPTLMASGLRLGSPAVSVAQDGSRRDSWLGQFMQQVLDLALST